MKRSAANFLLAACVTLASLLGAASALGQAVTPPSEDESTVSDDDVIVLNPFVVTTDNDKGYRATNTISGSRLDTPIKNIPMPIEVITEEFVRDTGARDLRQSMQYSAGIILKSQNDAGQGNTFVNSGGVNAYEGATAAKTQTSIKVRGFITDSVLRDGFRRQHSSDSINIGRIEVVRGPAALLYGIGNFGGIVNYIPKMPLPERRDEIMFTAGTNDLLRGAFDSTGPIGKDGKIGYRLTGAVETTGDFTDLFQYDHWFVSPVITWDPTPKTHVVLDFELGKETREGTGFQSVRARGDVPFGQFDRLEQAGFVEFAGKDRRTFRWSGPDTFVDTDSWNARFQVTQEIFERFNVLLGVNKSKTEFNVRDVNGAVQTGVGPAALRSSITVTSLVSNPAEPFNGTLNDAIFQYFWTVGKETNNREQVRVEATYNFDLFSNSRHDWLKMNHSFLLGRSEDKTIKKNDGTATINTASNFKSLADTSYFKFGTQGDGTPDVAMSRTQLIENTAWNQGSYAVHQGTFWDGRITTVAGVRRDRNDLNTVSTDFRGSGTPVRISRAPQSKDTTQLGVSIALIPQVSVFALKAEGLQPNFEGYRDADNVPIDATIAKSEEVGIKLDFMDGRISGTISKFKIKRTGTPFFYWWAPTTKGRFDASKDVVYLIDDFRNAQAWSPSQQAAIPEYNAAAAAGAVFTQGGRWYVNASTPTGAAYLDKVFASVPAGGWPGWLYDRYDPNGLVNFATLDWASPEDTAYQAWTAGDDESSGWDAQILFNPTDQLQFLVTYSRLDRVTLNAGKFVKYPSYKDRWAIWYFPDGNWGLTGKSLTEAYTDPSDTSTWTSAGYVTGLREDDTPKHHSSFWGTYRFENESLRGLTIGMGGWWQSKREFFSGITDGSGQLQKDANGNPIAVYTEDQLNIDAMARYEFKWRDHDARIQLNINNLFDDRDQYGFGFAPGISARIELGLVF
jgi:iron complex outermembrane recepter protein